MFNVIDSKGCLLFNNRKPIKICKKDKNNHNLWQFFSNKNILNNKDSSLFKQKIT